MLDLTSDLDIPVFIALSRRTDGGAEQIMFGFGAHLDPRVALLRAVTEMNQMLVHILDAPPEVPAVDRLSGPGDAGLAPNRDAGEPAVPCPFRRAAPHTRRVPAAED